MVNTKALAQKKEKIALNIEDALYFLERTKANNIFKEYGNINEVAACLRRIRDYTK